MTGVPVEIPQDIIGKAAAGLHANYCRPEAGCPGPGALAAEVERLTEWICYYEAAQINDLKDRDDARAERDAALAVITRVREWAEDWANLTGPVSVDPRGMMRGLLALLDSPSTEEQTNG